MHISSTVLTVIGIVLVVCVGIYFIYKKCSQNGHEIHLLQHTLQSQYTNLLGVINERHQSNISLEKPLHSQRILDDNYPVVLELKKNMVQSSTIKENCMTQQQGESIVIHQDDNTSDILVTNKEMSEKDLDKELEGELNSLLIEEVIDSSPVSSPSKQEDEVLPSVEKENENERDQID